MREMSGKKSADFALERPCRSHRELVDSMCEDTGCGHTYRVQQSRSRATPLQLRLPDESARSVIELSALQEELEADEARCHRGFDGEQAADVHHVGRTPT